MSLLSVLEHSGLPKRVKERKNIRDTIDVLPGCKFSQKKATFFCFVALASLENVFEMFFCVDGRAFSFWKGGEVKGEGSGGLSRQGRGSVSCQHARLA